MHLNTFCEDYKYQYHTYKELKRSNCRADSSVGNKYQYHTYKELKRQALLMGLPAPCQQAYQYHTYKELKLTT